MRKTVTQIAKKALYQLTEQGLPPTPENYTQYYYTVLGEPPPAPHPPPPAQEVTADVASQKLIEEISALLDDVTVQAEGLVTNLGQHNREMRGNIDDLKATEEKGTALQLLSTIMATADAILQNTEETHDGLTGTRQALEQIQAELQETRKLVQEDALTGTQNRRGMEVALTREITRAQRHERVLTVAMVDIDFFKKINDRYGHDAGDKMLIHLTTLLKAALRESDVLARYGGEEFLLILPDTDTNGAQLLLDRLRVAVGNTPMQYEGKRIRAAFSGGIAQLTPDDNAQGLVMRADSALYEAKHAGRNCVKVSAL
ncbi:MAG TPA: hypothetical protein DEP05_02780 [Betaproteobacteria bacterium]|nr:hypothetical protein [Betaproteobacteria bacterium]